MKQTLLFLFLLTIVLTAKGQTEQKITQDSKRFHIGINFSPDLCYRLLMSTYGNQSSQIIDSYNQTEIMKFGFTTGLNFSYNFTNNFVLETGFQYSNKGFQTKTNELNFGTMIDPRYGFIYPSKTNIAKAKFIYNYNYFDIPLIPKVIVGNSKLRFLAGIGISMNVFINKITNLVTTDSTGKTSNDRDTYTNGLRKINFTPIFSAGVDYKINDGMNLRIEPTLRWYGFSNTLDNTTPITEHLWSAGINVAYFIGF